MLTHSPQTNIIFRCHKSMLSHFGRFFPILIPSLFLTSDFKKHNKFDFLPFSNKMAIPIIISHSTGSNCINFDWISPAFLIIFIFLVELPYIIISNPISPLIKSVMTKQSKWTNEVFYRLYLGRIIFKNSQRRKIYFWLESHCQITLP